MTIEEKQAEMVRVLRKDGRDIVDSLSPEMADLWHMATGVAGEAGELLDAIKKHVIYGKELNHHNVVEELGDLEFYMEGIRSNCGITRVETLVQNQTKLKERYTAGVYSNEQAQERADKIDKVTGKRLL